MGNSTEMASRPDTSPFERTTLSTPALNVTTIGALTFVVRFSPCWNLTGCWVGSARWTDACGRNAPRHHHL